MKVLLSNSKRKFKHPLLFLIITWWLPDGDFIIIIPLFLHFLVGILFQGNAFCLIHVCIFAIWTFLFYLLSFMPLLLLWLSHRLKFLSTCSSVNSTVLGEIIESLGGYSLAIEVHHWGRALRILIPLDASQFLLCLDEKWDPSASCSYQHVTISCHCEL